MERHDLQGRDELFLLFSNCDSKNGELAKLIDSDDTTEDNIKQKTAFQKNTEQCFQMIGQKWKYVRYMMIMTIIILTVMLFVISSAIFECKSQDYNCHGDVTQLHPSGMHNGGRAGSHNAIDADINEINKRKSCYVQAGANNCIHPAVVAGLASRESRAGRLLYSTNGWGDHHHAYGIMQCDINANPLHSVGKTCTSYAWDSCAHINALTKYVLVPNIVAVKRKHPSWSDAQALQGGVAAYNFGVGNVQSWGGLDIGSTGNDYSNDVVARAQWLISHYHW